MHGTEPKEIKKSAQLSEIEMGIYCLSKTEHTLLTNKSYEGLGYMKLYEVFSNKILVLPSNLR